MGSGRLALRGEMGAIKKKGAFKPRHLWSGLVSGLRWRSGAQLRLKANHRHCSRPSCFLEAVPVLYRRGRGRRKQREEEEGRGEEHISVTKRL